MELEHVSHVNPSISSEEQKIEGENVSCFACKEIISPSYHCPKCHFFVQKKMQELPVEIKHPLHRQHRLFLLDEPPYPSGGFICDLCEKSSEDSVYHCSQCTFDLDINCALPPCIIEPEGDSHRFIHLIRSMLFTCDACGKDGDQSPYVCTMCQLMVHKQCISLPRTIRIAEHSHLISHSYFIQKNELYSHPYCGICQGDVKTQYGAYYCLNCNYVAHVDCAKQHVINVAVTDQSMVGESQPGEEAAAVEKQQFSHEHDLAIIDEDIGDNKRCDGCMLPLSAPIYGCPQCHIFLHKKCSELPTKMRHPLHQHSLTLHHKAPSVDGVFKCSACDQYCHGFSYNCDKCDFYLDIRCSTLISTTLEHLGHPHPLRLVLGERNYGCFCSACYHCRYTYFCCSYCGFTLDFGCATLQKTITHSFDEHPLTLNFNSLYDKSDPDYCEICEQERDPNTEVYRRSPWFYHCPDCNITMHAECFFGRYPYIKFGGAYLYDIHEHPLTLVQKEEHYPPCDNCAEPFFVAEKVGDPNQDLALQCTECSFVIHRKGPCFDQHINEGTKNLS